MTFEQLQYIRPNIKVFEKEFSTLLEEFKAAQSAEEQAGIIKKINDSRQALSAQGQLAYIRHSLDTIDEFYKKENDFFDEQSPIVAELVSRYYKALSASAFKPELEKRFGRQLFSLAEMAAKTINPEVIPDLQKENTLATKYDRLIASAKVSFRGKEYNLSQLRPFMIDKDRSLRKQACLAKHGFYLDNAAELDELYDELVKTRTRMAQKLGYDNFISLAYDRMDRSDYSAEDAKIFREQLKKLAVPAVSQLKQQQAERINVDKLKYYDEGFQFPDGNPMPQGDSRWIVEQARKMYSEISGETKEFFEMMTENKLMDLETRPGKSPGGYASFIQKYRYPFIFANFNKTDYDVHVMTHEAGHAFQFYMSRGLDLPEYTVATKEACEIPSMAMEFFALPFVELFFGDGANKYRRMHTADSFVYLPYIAAVDEFQHLVYGNPSMSPADRKQAWQDLENEYLPHKDYEDNEFLLSGSMWQQQLHIYEVPFYYIDYALAQVGAYEFWLKAEDSHDDAWQQYLKLCQLGGSLPYLELLKEAGLSSPFLEGGLEIVLKNVKMQIDKL